MGIIRIEEICYGVTDLSACSRFCADLGLEELTDGAMDQRGTRFRTRTNQHLRLVAHDDASLPHAVDAAPTIREIVWGVADDADVVHIGNELSRDRDVDTGTAGTVRSHDDTGFSIAFRRADVRDFSAQRRPFNSFGKTERVNSGLAAYGRAAPIRLIHVALDIPKLGHEAMARFYVDRLGFKPVENILPTGTFLQCQGETDHHQLFLCHRTDRAGVNHLALEVADFDQVIEGGNHMVACGWKEARRLGRHTVGSNMFRFFQAPWGGRIELVTDMDKVDKATPPRTWEQSPPHHLWMIKTSGES